MWRMFGYHIHHRKPAVQKLIIHLPGEQNITYRATDDLSRVLAREDIEKTMLTAWMDKNEESEEARELTYLEFPTRFTWNSDNKVWMERQQIGREMVGRIVNIHPTAGQLYYLRILLNKLRGPRSFDEILTVDGKKYEDFKSACYARGLLDSDSEWHDAMDEAIQWATPHQLRHLFVLLLIFCEVGSPLKLWNRCWKSLGEDMLYKQRKTFNFKRLHLEESELQQYTLIEVEKVMHQYEHSLTEFKDMPQPDQDVLKELGNSLLTQESQYNVHKEKKEHIKLFRSLNVQQKQVYDAVMGSVENGLGKLFFLYGPGGTGKTYLYSTIISKLRSEKKVVLPVASSGIAALLLPFGGKTVLLGGDFRQTLPVIPQGSRADTVLASIRQSYLWDSCEVYSM